MTTDSITAFVIGLGAGIALILLLNFLRKRDARSIAREVVKESEIQKTSDIETILGRIRESFGSMSLDALTKNTEHFLNIAKETLSSQTRLGEKELEGKKKLIDQTLDSMKTELEKVQSMVTRFEKDRESKFGELASQLKLTSEQTSKLQETTTQLREALSSSQTRGQWGERMAEDVLRLAGFINGVNYYKQQTISTVGSRPDYTFLLPQGLKVHMDVKFPLDNFLRHLEANGEMEQEMYKTQFLKDVKGRIKEVTTREYINPEENTLDYVIVFIPNERVYAFIHEHDPTILDSALENKVILCSPLTLYAILAVIRHAVDNFNMQQAATEMLSLFGAFHNQWSKFVDSFDKMGKKIQDAQNEFISLSTTRKNQLERPLRKIEDLRKQKGIAQAVIDDDDDDNPRIETPAAQKDAQED